MNLQRLRSLGTPTAATDATTKQYVDNAVAAAGVQFAVGTFGTISQTQAAPTVIGDPGFSPDAMMLQLGPTRDAISGPGSDYYSVHIVFRATDVGAWNGVRAWGGRGGSGNSNSDIMYRLNADDTIDLYWINGQDCIRPTEGRWALFG
jgi:hypothetical protein